MGNVATNHLQFVTPVSRSHHFTQAYILNMPFSRTNYHHHSFFPKTTMDWNALPPGITFTPMLISFTNQLGKLPQYEDKSSFYIHTAQFHFSPDFLKISSHYFYFHALVHTPPLPPVFNKLNFPQ